MVEIADQKVDLADKISSEKGEIVRSLRCILDSCSSQKDCRLEVFVDEW